MKNICCAIPIGFNIKTKTGVICASTKLHPPFLSDILGDIEENPHRWEVTYAKEPDVKPAPIPVPFEAKDVSKAPKKVRRSRKKLVIGD